MTDKLQIGISALDALASVAAVVIAIVAWRLASSVFKRDHRPLVRVAASEPEAGQPATEKMSMKKVILKNIGRGPGVTVIAYNPSNAALIGDVEAAEPLGSAEKEQNRPGRVPMELREAMKMDVTYELYYQDILGKWHVTRFRPEPWKIQCTFAGEKGNSEIPEAVRIRGTVARP